MVSATEMAKPFGKEAKDWLKNQSTKDFINELSNVRNLLYADLVQVKQGSPENGGGTWLHEDVAMEFARWLSPKFAIWCNDRIKELLSTGQAQLKPMTQGQMLVQMAQAYELQERMLLEQQAKQRVMESKIHKLECVTDVNYGFMAVLGYAKLHGINVSRKEASKIGKAVSNYCRSNKIEYGSQKHPIFGNVNIYPDHALQAVFPKFYPGISF